MDLIELKKLRDDVYETMKINWDIPIETQILTEDKAIKEFIEAGKKYYNNPNLTFTQLNKLLHSEETINTNIDFESLSEIRELVLKQKYQDPVMERRDKNIRLGNYITLARIYYANPNLTYEQIEELYNQEKLDSEITNKNNR